MGIKIYCIAFLFFNCFFAASQDSINEQDKYIQRFPEKFTIRIGLLRTSNSFIIADTASEEVLELQPNDKTYLGASFLFRSVELDLGFAPNFLSENKDNDGSKLFTLNFRMFLGQWMQTLDFYNQKGFFVSNNENAIVIPFPELTTLKIGGTTGYVFNTNFSFRAIGFQNEWQKRSAGSFIPRFTLYYTKFDLHDNTPESVSNSYDLAIGPGYYYNWVIKRHFIFSLGANAGFGVNFTTSDGNTDTTALYQILFRTVIGYNSENFYTGINTSAQLLQHSTAPNTVLDDTLTFLEFYVGYRFNAPKKWIEKGDKFNRKFGLD